MIETYAPLHWNRPLASFRGSDLDGLRRKLERVSFSCGEIVQQLNAPIDHVYFPVNMVVSLLRTTTAGEQLEVAMIGSEGVFGWPVCAELSLSPYAVTVLVPGEAYRIPVVAMQDEIEFSPTWRRFVELQQSALSEALVVTGTCSGLHSVTQRCCRWLLTAQDYLETQSLPFTQELIARHLGVRRPSISQVIVKLQEEQIVHRTHRGKIAILDHVGLQVRSCGCQQLLHRNRRRAVDVSGVRQSFPVRPTI